MTDHKRRPRTQMLDFLSNFSADERGATAIEYGLICALLVIAMSVGLNGVATETSNMWTNVSNRVAAAIK